MSDGLLKVEGAPGFTHVAVKQLLPPTGDPENIAFIKALDNEEVRILQTTTSSVKPKFYGIEGGDKIVMDFVDGVSVSMLLENATP